MRARHPSTPLGTSAVPLRGGVTESAATLDFAQGKRDKGSCACLKAGATSIRLDWARCRGGRCPAEASNRRYLCGRGTACRAPTS